MLSVIVPIYSNATLVEYSLNQLLQHLPGGAELIIVDDASDLETHRTLQTFSSNRIIRHEWNRGNTAAYNTGAAAARGEILAFVDSDVFVPPGALDDFAELVAGDTSIGAVGSLLLFPYDFTIQHAGVAFDRWVLSHLYVGRLPQDVILADVEERQAVTAAFLACSREIFNKVGGFNEAYRDGLEDIEFCLRCRQLGRHNLLLSRRPAMHLESATRGPHKHIRRTYNYSIFFSRWSGQFVIDLPDFVRANVKTAGVGTLSSYMIVVLNFCTTPNWSELAEIVSSTGAKLSDAYDLSGRIPESEPIDLFRAVPLAFQRSPSPILFVVDHFAQLSRNRLWFQRRVAEDLIVDRHANVLTSKQFGHGACND